MHVMVRNVRRAICSSIARRNHVVAKQNRNDRQYTLPSLLFVQVEEIARFALDSFPVSQPVELKQYLEQFLGQSKVRAK